MQALKIRRVGNSLGLPLPKNVGTQLQVKEGDTLFLTPAPYGFFITPYDETFQATVAAFEEGAGQFRNALRELEP